MTDCVKIHRELPSRARARNCVLTDGYVAPVCTLMLRGSALAVAVPFRCWYKNRIKLPYKPYKLLSGQIHPAAEEKRQVKAKRLIFVTRVSRAFVRVEKT